MALPAATNGERTPMSAFPDDLLAVIYHMLASPPGRVRFAAVCRSWRAASRRAPPAGALPWLLLSPGDGERTKRLYCPEDGAIVRVPLPSSMWLVGCHDGGWVISLSPMLYRLRILNLFSGAEVMLSEKQRRIVSDSHYHDVRKIVFSDHPTASGCILAAVIDNKKIWLCRIGCPKEGWTVQRFADSWVHDIAFCNGELYGVKEGALFKYEMDVNKDDTFVITADHRIASDHQFWMGYCADGASYIFDLCGKIAMAVKTTWSGDLVPFFKVFELGDIHAGGSTAPYENSWVEVTNLGDHALFLGKIVSKSVRVCADRHGGVERNHIYYIYHPRSSFKQRLLAISKIIISHSISKTCLDEFHGRESSLGSCSSHRKSYD